MRSPSWKHALADILAQFKKESFLVNDILLFSKEILLNVIFFYSNFRFCTVFPRIVIVVILKKLNGGPQVLLFCPATYLT